MPLLIYIPDAAAHAHLLCTALSKHLIGTPNTPAGNPDICEMQVRPRGWHLWEKHVLVDGRPVPGGIFDFAMFFFHCARPLLDRGSGAPGCGAVDRMSIFLPLLHHAVAEYCTPKADAAHCCRSVLLPAEDAEPPGGPAVELRVR
jgi:Malate synthase